MGKGKHISEEVRAAVLRDREAGMSRADAAAKHRVHETTIRRIDEGYAVRLCSREGCDVRARKNRPICAAHIPRFDDHSRRRVLYELGVVAPPPKIEAEEPAPDRAPGPPYRLPRWLRDEYATARPGGGW